MTRTGVILLVHEGKVLVLLRGATAPWYPLHWNLPGGTVDEHETPGTAAIRECVEETALWPLCPRLLDVIDMGDDGLLHAYVSDVGEGPVRTCWESESHAWIGLNEIEGYKFVPFVEALLREALTPQ